MSNVERSVLRDVVPVLIGTVVSYATKQWAKLPTQDAFYLFPFITSAYSTLIHFAEQKYTKLGWLLGCLPAKVVAPQTAPEVPTAPSTPAA